MAVLALLLTATTVYAAPLATANGFSREVVTGDATIGIMYEGVVGANVRHGIVDGIARVSDGEVLLVDQLVSLTVIGRTPAQSGADGEVFPWGEAELLLAKVLANHESLDPVLPGPGGGGDASCRSPQRTDVFAARPRRSGATRCRGVVRQNSE